MTKQSNLIFLDIDGTLLDSSYRSNERGLKSFIQQMPGSYTFGLNSNRALEDLLPVAEQFSISGPLIGENGLFAYYPGSAQTKYLLGRAALKELARIKAMVESVLQETLCAQYRGTVHWKNVDTVDTLPKAESRWRFNEGDIVVLNNKFRKYTVSAHLKVYRDGKLVPVTSKELDSITKNVCNIFIGKGITITYSPTFGNILMYTNQISKRSAIEKLRHNDFPESILYAIGDELNDYYMIEGIGTFLTVGNAANEVKKKATVSAHKAYAQGVRELLEGVVSVERGKF